MPLPRNRRMAAAVSAAVAATLFATACMAGQASGSPRESGAEPSRGASDAGSPVAKAEGIGDDYWPRDGNRGIDVRHYDIHDAYRFGDGRLSGHTVITLRATRDLETFDLDFLLPVSQVRVDGVRAEHRTPQHHELLVRPATPLEKGQTAEVKVTYAGRPARYGYAGERNWLASGREVVTMNQPHMAPWWFPSNDHPRDKATFDITITGPRNYQVVSNGLPGKRTASDGRATTHWHSEHPMATYLAFFALGRFDIIRGTKHGLPYYVAVSKAISPFDRRTAEQVLSQSPQVTAWLARRLGRYPFESTGGLTTSLPVGFALENQTRPTYPTSFGSSASVIVHELAHQWFGDSVSLDRWRDIWLNEGFASFMEVAYDEAHHGKPGRAWLQEQYLEHRGDTAYWRLDIADPGAAHVFDGPVYNRGAMALQALRNKVGNHDFWKTLHTWVTDRRYGVGRVPQFEQLANRISGRHLGRFFDVWLRRQQAPAHTKSNGLR